MELKDIKAVYFIGIGGIGMSAIARYFLKIGVAVGGYDRTESDLTRKLCEEGAMIHYEENPRLLKFNRFPETMSVYGVTVSANTFPSNIVCTTIDTCCGLAFVVFNSCSVLCAGVTEAPLGILTNSGPCSPTSVKPPSV